MLKHHFSLICSQAVIDERTKALSIFDVIERINLNADPEKAIEFPMRFDLISVWVKCNDDSSNNGISRVSLCKPNGEIKIIHEVAIDLTDTTFFRSVINFQGIKLQGSGEYKFIIELKQSDESWEKVSEVSFFVFFTMPEGSS